MGMDALKWILVVLAVAGMFLSLFELAMEGCGKDAASDRLPADLKGMWVRQTTNDRLEATVTDGKVEIVRVDGGSREVRWKGVYKAEGREWTLRETSKGSHTTGATHHDDSTMMDIILTTTMS